jgi:hypothetical protein
MQPIEEFDWKGYKRSKAQRIFITKMFYLWSGRNAWHCSWSSTYPGILAFHLSLTDAKDEIGRLRVQGSTWNIREIPAIAFMSEAITLVVAEINADSPFINNTMEHEKLRKAADLHEQLAESLSTILLGEKIPLDVVNSETGEIIIPSNLKLTKTLLRKLASVYDRIEIDPSPIRNKINEILGAFRKRFEDLQVTHGRTDKTTTLRTISERLDPNSPNSMKQYLTTDVLEPALMPFRQYKSHSDGGHYRLGWTTVKNSVDLQYTNEVIQEISQQIQNSTS